MTARHEVHRLAWDLWQDPALRERFLADDESVFDAYGMTAEERRLLRDGSPPALHALGMHPLVQMPYTLLKTPPLRELVDASGYLDALR